MSTQTGVNIFIQGKPGNNPPDYTPLAKPAKRAAGLHVNLENFTHLEGTGSTRGSFGQQKSR
jgi:hypothetical protein